MIALAAGKELWVIDSYGEARQPRTQYPWPVSSTLPFTASTSSNFTQVKSATAPCGLPQLRPEPHLMVALIRNGIRFAEIHLSRGPHYLTTSGGIRSCKYFIRHDDCNGAPL